ncbi:MAG: membrane protein insertase YidC [Anaerolineae bacterium]|nr:MAG: membrane protein insertase YidC [Anaerolineae bacterium]
MWDTFIVTPLTNLLLWIYYTVGHNANAFGLAIILFTILIRLATHPLTRQQIKSAQAMQELQKSKRWQEIQKKYKNDRERLAQEQMKLYQELGVNPFGSCLPTLIQFPIILGLYQAIIRALAATPLELLRLTRSIYPSLDVASIIPLNSRFLWMDLGRPESVQVLGVGVPVLAIIVALTTYIQSKLTMPATQPDDQSAQMGKMMSLYMPLFLFYLAITFPSGLTVYFITSNVVGILQYAAMGRVNWGNLLPALGKRSEK